MLKIIIGIAKLIGNALYAFTFMLAWGFGDIPLVIYTSINLIGWLIYLRKDYVRHAAKEKHTKS